MLDVAPVRLSFVNKKDAPSVILDLQLETLFLAFKNNALSLSSFRRHASLIISLLLTPSAFEVILKQSYNVVISFTK